MKGWTSGNIPPATPTPSEPTPAPETTKRPWQSKPGFRGGRALRLKPGERTKVETAREAVLVQRLAAGQILDYGFQRVTFRMADRSAFTPDFDVVMPDGRWVLEDVKGVKFDKEKQRYIPWIEEDARLKLKIVAALFPFEFRAVWREPAKAGGRWFFETFKGWTDGTPQAAEPQSAEETTQPAPERAAPDLFESSETAA